MRIFYSEINGLWELLFTSHGAGVSLLSKINFQSTQLEITFFHSIYRKIKNRGRFLPLISRIFIRNFSPLTSIALIYQTNKPHYTRIQNTSANWRFSSVLITNLRFWNKKLTESVRRKMIRLLYGTYQPKSMQTIVRECNSNRSFCSYWVVKS